MELHDALLFDLEAILGTFVHERLLEVLALDHGVLAIGEDLLRDHIFVHFLRPDHLLVSLQVILALCEITSLQEWVLQVLGRVGSSRRGLSSPVESVPTSQLDSRTCLNVTTRSLQLEGSRHRKVSLRFRCERLARHEAFTFRFLHWKLKSFLNFLDFLVQAVIIERLILGKLHVSLPAFLDKLLQAVLLLAYLFFSLHLLQLAKLILPRCFNVDKLSHIKEGLFVQFV